MPTGINIQVEDSGHVTVTVGPPQLAAGSSPQAAQQQSAGRRCCTICGDKFASQSVRQTCGNCYTAGMDAKTERERGAVAGESADNQVPLESGAAGPPAIAQTGP
jgi:formate dehydrogenase assembly factor FdhD